MNCLFVALSVLLCTIGVQGNGPCQRHLYLWSLRPFAGQYVPQCTLFGYFKVVQVHGSTGHSWCVNPETGAKVESSDVAPGAGKPQCGKCFNDLAKYISSGSFINEVIIGRFKPQCDENGLFNEMQYRITGLGGDGYSWCVNPQTGEKIEGTLVFPGNGQANCGQAPIPAPIPDPTPAPTPEIDPIPAPTPAIDPPAPNPEIDPIPEIAIDPPAPNPEIAAIGFTGPCVKSEATMPGQFNPQCTPEGYYQILQRHGSTGYSFCVNPETGEKIEGTEVPPTSMVIPACGKCLHALAEYHSVSSGMVSVGRTHPSCDAQGLFTPKQSSASSGYSWCVDPETGDKIEGTEVAPGAGEANCEHARQTRATATDGPCNIFAMALSLRPIGGFFKPQCSESGYWQIIQRDPNTGYRFCVNPENGNKIDGTEVPPNSNAIPKCGKCLYAVAQYWASNSMAYGRPYPSCNAQGLYNAKQSSSSSGYSWCVDPETGDKIEGTDVAPAAGQASCGGRQKRGLPGPCTAQQGKPALIGAYVPQCTPFGFFQVIQTHASTGYRFCVNPETGVQVAGNKMLTDGEPTCGQCLYALASTLNAGLGPVGMTKPKCDIFGNFNALQSSGSTGYSWCVDPETGARVPGSEVAPGAGRATCGDRQKRSLPGPCTQQRDEQSLLLGPPMIGRFIPQCTIFGFYQVIQRHGSTGFSFCVNPETGVKVEGSDVRGNPNCGKCLYDLAHTHVAGPIGPVRPPGSPPRPQCDETGNYSPVQYSGSTGYSWCVDPATGAKIEGTDVAPGAGPASCGGRQKRGLPGPCTAQQSQPGLIGAYVPQCTPFGFFQVIQTHASTGYKFCVNPVTGERAAGNKLPPSRDDPECGQCFYALARTLNAGPIGPVGMFKPHCDASGSFASIQTHEGHRFCVDTNTGVQLPGSPSFGPGDSSKLPCEN